MLYLIAIILGPIAVLILLHRKQWHVSSRIWPAMLFLTGLKIASEMANNVWPSLLLFIAGLGLFALPVILVNNLLEKVRPLDTPRKLGTMAGFCFASGIVGAVGFYHYAATPSCFSEGLITEDMTIREIEELCYENND